MELPNFSQAIVDAANAFVTGNAGALASLSASDYAKAIALVLSHEHKKLAQLGLEIEILKEKYQEVLKQNPQMKEAPHAREPIRPTQQHYKTK